tara:strand:+ start:138 stop:383 length:246 start_codon:yes stop_codon:yes gene_type:complete
MSKLFHSNPDLDDVYTREEELEKMNVCVHEHSVTFRLVDDDGNELTDKDGNVRVFTAPSLDDYVESYAFDMVTVSDLEEVT